MHALWVRNRCVICWVREVQCVAVCCSVLQCVAVCCSVLLCVAVCCNDSGYIEFVTRESPIYTRCRYFGWWVCMNHFGMTLSTEIATLPKSTKSRNSDFSVFGISRYQFELIFWANLRLYRGIWVSGYGGFRRCSICSGKGHMCTISVCIPFRYVYQHINKM